MKTCNQKEQRLRHEMKQVSGVLCMRFTAITNLSNLSIYTNYFFPGSHFRWVLPLFGTPSVHIHRDLTRTTHCRYKSEADSKAQLSSTFTSSCPMFLHHYHPSRRSQHFESTREQDLFACSRIPSGPKGQSGRSELSRTKANPKGP